MRSKHTTNIEIEILSSLFDAGVISVVAVWLSNTSSLLNGQFFIFLRLSRSENIQMLTALVLQLIQCVVNLPARLGRVTDVKVG